MEQKITFSEFYDYVNSKNYKFFGFPEDYPNLWIILSKMLNKRILKYRFEDSFFDADNNNKYIIAYVAEDK